MTIDAHATDADLVASARAGDRAAFGSLVRRYEDAACTTAYAYLADHEVAREIAQDAFVSAWLALGRLRDPVQFGPWLRTIVRHRAIALGRRTRLVGYIRDDQEVQAGPRTTTPHRNAEIRDAIMGIPARQREALLVTALNGFSYDRAATYLGLPVTTLKGRIQQARARLRNTLGEDTEVRMEPASIGENVAAAIARIAREQIDERIPLDGMRHVVLFLGVPAEVEICGTDGGDVRITGTRASIGTDEDDARRSLAGLRLAIDRVDDYLAAGPGAGETFVAPGVDAEGRPIGRGTDIAKRWRSIVREDLAAIFPYGDYHGKPTDPGDLARDVRESLAAPAHRVTLVRKRMEDIAVPGAAYEDLRGGFRANWLTAELAHGPRGYADLVVAVPSGTAVTVIPDQWFPIPVRAWGLRGEVTLVGCRDVEIEDVEGRVRLVNSMLRRAERMRGELVIGTWRLGATDWSGNRMRRSWKWTAEIRDMVGKTRIDILHGDLDLRDIAGTLDVRNRYGRTRLAIDRHEPDTRHRIASDAGDVSISFAASLAGEISLTATALSGSIDFSAIEDFGPFDQRSDQYLMSASTVPARAYLAPEQLAADLVVRTEAGEIRFERT